MDIHLSEFSPWTSRATLSTDAGVYVVAKAGEVVYIGKSWGAGGLRGRLADFHRSATTGRKGHAGGVTFFGKFGAIIPDEISVAVHMPIAIRREAGILYPYVCQRRNDFRPLGRSKTRCLIPGFNGAIFSNDWKDALWARFSTGAPARQRRCVERYSIVKRA